MVDWLASQGGYINVPKDKLIGYAYALASKYGEASAAAAAQMYDEIAEASGVSVPLAEVADTATYGEIARAVNGVTKKLTTDGQIGNVVGRHVKLAGADTMLKNALRDGAEFAWIPSGDTCAFCLMLASNGWQKASPNALKGGHAEHIHANCDCTYAIRFDGKSNVKGYDPEKYRRMYYGAEGDNWRDKLNSMRRMKYAENPEKYRAQSRANYSKKKVLISQLITGLTDEYVPKSVGAKIKNFDIMDLKTGIIYHLVEGTYLQNKKVFAGKDGSVPYRKAYLFAEKYGGNPSDWNHVKAIGLLETEDGDRLAEIHWSECDGIGKVEMFVKEWLDES